MSSNNSCEGCGFEWDSVSAPQITQRITAAASSFASLIESAGSRAGARPSPERWSALEYGAHLRDVLISIRERIIAASVVDEPTGSAIHRDERVALGFYRLDTPSEVARELTVVARLFVRTLESLPAGYEGRRFIYSPVTPARVTILWAGAQALHECEHHLGDAEENLTLL